MGEFRKVLDFIVALQKPVARGLVSANHLLGCTETYTFLWWLTLVSANHASSNSGSFETNKNVGEQLQNSGSAHANLIVRSLVERGKTEVAFVILCYGNEWLCSLVGDSRKRIQKQTRKAQIISTVVFHCAVFWQTQAFTVRYSALWFSHYFVSKVCHCLNTVDSNNQMNYFNSFYG